VLLFALLMTVVAMVILVWKVNALTAVLTFASLIGYAFIYTFFLKRITPQNIVIGGAAGAAPPVLGWAAVTGQVTPDALPLPDRNERPDLSGRRFGVGNLVSGLCHPFAAFG